MKRRSIQRAVCRLRRQLESECLRRHGSVTLEQCATINTITRLETSCRLAQAWIAEHPDAELSALAALNRDVGRLSVERDKMIRLLKLEEPDPYTTYLSTGKFPDDEPEPDSPATSLEDK